VFRSACAERIAQFDLHLAPRAAKFPRPRATIHAIR
jgi:hypothetical protein